jgi:glycerol-3-phosphate acyltransferase PlsX
VEEKLDSFFSAGNTCSYMGLAKIILKTLPVIDRPAIVNKIPTFKGERLFLDLGGNIQCRLCHLVKFVLMGEKFVQHVFGIPNPKVG